MGSLRHIAGLLLFLSNATYAAQPRSFDIPAQSLADALALYARQAGVQIFFPTDPIAGRQSVPVKGHLAGSQVLRRLLAGSSLEVASDDGQTVVLRATPPKPVVIRNDSDAASPLEEVIIRGAPRAGALKRGDDTVVNTITELEISRLPNLDVSDVLARLPGVLRNDTQSGEDRYVQIRDLVNAAASQSIDGVLLTDYINSSRATSTELIPANFLKNITVTTTVTPDLDENSNAAHVAMSTISGLDNDGQRLLDFRGYLGQDNRSGGDRSTPQPMRLAGSWRGALDNAQRFGVAVAAELDKLGSRQDAVSIAGYNVINGVDVPNGAMTRGATYTQTKRVAALVRFDARPTDTLTLFGEYLYLQHHFETDQQTASASVVATQGADIGASSGQFNSAGQVYGFNQGTPGLTDHVVQLGGDWRRSAAQALSFRAGATLNRVTQGSVSLDGFGSSILSLLAPLGYNISGNNIRLSPGVLPPTQYLLSGKTTVNDTVSEDHNYFARIDYLGNISQPGWGFKTGVQLKTLDRANEQRGYAQVLPIGAAISLSDVSGSSNPWQFNPVNWNQTEFLQLLDQRGVPSGDPADGYGQDFTASERIGVAYGVISYGLDHGRLSAGARVAYTHRQLDQYQPDAAGLWGPAHYEQSYTNVLPSVYGYQDLTSQLKFRAAFTQTLQRPALAGSAPMLLTSYDTPVTRTITYNDPYLRPIRSTNFDTSLEYYLGPDDAYVSLGLFSKYLKDIPAVSSSESIGADGVREITNYNSNVTEVNGRKVYGQDQGVELTWSEPSLGFLPRRCGNLGVTLGYDFIVYRLTAINGGNGVAPTDTRLVDAGPRHFFNLSLFYNWRQFAANVFLQAASSLPTMSYNPANDERVQYAPLLDFQVSYAVTGNFRLLLEGRNVLDQSISTYYGVTGYGPTYQVRHNGRTLWLGAQVASF